MFVINQVIVKAQQLRRRHIPKYRLAYVADELGVTFATAIIVDHDFQEIRFGSEFPITAGSPENGVERVDMFNMETDLQIGPDRFHRVMDFLQDLVFAEIEKLVPKENFR